MDGTVVLIVHMDPVFLFTSGEPCRIVDSIQSLPTKGSLRHVRKPARPIHS
jgi:hypothetical protein